MRTTASTAPTADQQQRAPEPAAATAPATRLFAQRADARRAATSTALRSSACSLRSSSRALPGRLAVGHAPVRAARGAVGGSRFARSSSSSIRRCTYRLLLRGLGRFGRLAKSVLRCHLATALAESFQVQRSIYPRRRPRERTRRTPSAPATTTALRRADRGARRGAPPAPARRGTTRRRAVRRSWRNTKRICCGGLSWASCGTEGRAGLLDLQRAEEVDAEEAALAAQLRAGAARAQACSCGCCALLQFLPRFARCRWDATIKPQRRGRSSDGPWRKSQRKRLAARQRAEPSRHFRCDNAPPAKPQFPRPAPIIICGSGDPAHRRQRLRRLAAAAGAARDGHSVRAMTRDPARLARRAAQDRASEVARVVRGDAVSGEGLRAALAGVEVAYYLIHSMERVAGRHAGFVERERLAAQNFAALPREAGVRQDRLPRRPRAALETAAAGARAGAARSTSPAARRSSGCCCARCPTRSRCGPRS